MPLNFGTVDYSSSITPKKYVCDFCGAHDCKLWREANTFLSNQTLACCQCAGKENNKDVSDIDEQGKIPWEPLAGSKSRIDQIGWRIPAIPDEEGYTYWGYSSVPWAGVQWWYSLSSKPNRTPAERQTFATMLGSWLKREK